MGFSIPTPSPLLCCCLCCFCGIGHLSFIFMIGNAEGKTPFDDIYRVLYVKLPLKTRQVFRFIFGPKFDVYWDSFIHYLFYTNNCCAQVFYLLLTVGGYTGFIFTGYPHFPTPYLPDNTPWVSFIMMILCLISFVAVSVSDPGTITDENVDELEQLYEYDNILFQEGRICETCKIPKIPRSKHCRLCDRCVLKFDHHCIWVGNCIGFNNIYLFLIFLFIHTVLTIYGAIALFLLLRGIIHQQGLWNAHFIDRETRQAIPPSWTIILQYISGQYLTLAYLWVCCAVFALVLICFTTWHFYLALVARSTTNEGFKRRNLLHDDEHNDSLDDNGAIPNIYAQKNRGILYEVFCPRRWAEQILAARKED